MAENDTIKVKDLALDLTNFRTMPQRSERRALHAIISINPDWFWALTKSLIEEGYLPTENILVLSSGPEHKQLVVKEGNRRIGALKLILGQISTAGLDVPSDIKELINSVPNKWKKENASVPCSIYQPSEETALDKVVALIHGKGEKAGRDKWKAVARARHNRDKSGAAEVALDLLEEYLKHGRNLNELQKERWSGDYPLTVLDEAIKRIAPRFGAKSSREFSDQYPKTISHRAKVEEMLRDIGLEKLGFAEIRDENKDIFTNDYGFPSLPKTASASGTAGGASASGAGSTSGGSSSATKPTATQRRKNAAYASNDPRSVIRELKSFTPVGKNRDKVVTLLAEARTLNISKQPHAFCFLLRSMFEISAKAYCKDHAKSSGPSATKASGEDRTLVDVLRDITQHLTKGKTDKAMVKVLHGAMAELAKQDGFLSVTSMNQLVHHPRFSVDESHISTLFSNIFPLLEEMNK